MGRAKDVAKGSWMNIKSKIKTTLKEAEIYQHQGLLAEAKAKYENAAHLIQKNEQLKNRDSLLEAISKKINALKGDESRIQQSTSSPQLSSKAQNLIKQLFAFPGEGGAEAQALEGAMALAKFGQYDRALTEFSGLLKSSRYRLTAAKNILRCHMTGTSAEKAVAQYEQWLGSDQFAADQLETLRVFLERLLGQKGVTLSLPQPSFTGSDEMFEPDDDEEVFIDISSVGITFERGPNQGKMIEFDVNFQSGNTISLIIPSQDKNLIETLDTGSMLSDVQFYSPIAIFKGTCEVASRTQIKTGPKQGDFCLDLRITST